MAVVDVQGRTIILKIVYFGCALGGKTTNLLTLHRLTDPSDANGLVSIATKDDRTLFFDLLPMDLGQIAGLQVKCKLYTVPGQVHYEVTRRQVLGGADGVVFVADSSTDQAKTNLWAIENLRLNLRANGLDPDKTPVVMQWNKRDLPDARPVAELETQLNQNGLPSLEAVATTGVGVIETFATVLEGAVLEAYRKNGRPVARETIAETIGRALAAARAAVPRERRTDPAFEHRFDMESYRDQEAERGRNRTIVDQESLLKEAVSTNMMLAERLGGLSEARAVGERRSQMMDALGKVTPMLADPTAAALPEGVAALLLEGAQRRAGSLLFFKPGADAMDEREIVGADRDPLNGMLTAGLGSVALGLVKPNEFRLVEDLRGEVLFDMVPHELQETSGVAVVPIACDGLAFGGMLVYVQVNEPPLDDAEHQYWITAATLLGLSLHWRALRRKLSRSTPARATT